jgi:hypothetical protein
MFTTIVTRREPCVEQELETLPEHMSVPPLFSVKCFVDLDTLKIIFPLSLVLSTNNPIIFKECDYALESVYSVQPTLPN